MFQEKKKRYQSIRKGQPHPLPFLEIVFHGSSKLLILKMPARAGLRLVACLSFVGPASSPTSVVDGGMTHKACVG